MTQLTHKEAVKRIAHWLRNSKRCGVVMAELRTQNNETPDCIGWHGAGSSILVECKVSRADFFADREKVFRQWEDFGMGDLRYFATPPGMVEPADLPAGWGLLYIQERSLAQSVVPEPKQANKRAEVKMLMSSIRRLQISTAVFVTHEPVEILD